MAEGYCKPAKEPTLRVRFLGTALGRRQCCRLVFQERRLEFKQKK